MWVFGFGGFGVLCCCLYLKRVTCNEHGRQYGAHEGGGGAALKMREGFGVWDLGFGIWGLGFGVWGLGFGVWGLGYWVLGFGFTYEGLLRQQMRSLAPIYNTHTCQT